MCNLFDHLSSELLERPKLQVTRAVTTQSEEDPIKCKTRASPGRAPSGTFELHGR
jgi:hypothetical protein